MRSIKKLLAGIIALAVIGAGGYVVYSISKSPESEETQSVRSREFTVAKGDITVGLSESGSVTLGREYVTFAANAEVAEILVKVGMSVEEGDSIARFDTDDISDICSDYEKKLASARLAYSQAQVEAKSKLSDAKLTYDESISSAEFADTDYSLTITQSASEITLAEDKLASDQKQLAEYKSLAENYPDDYAVLCAYEDKLDEYEAVYKGYEEKLSEMETEYKALSKAYSEYETQYKEYEKELESIKDDYNAYLDSVSEKQAEIQAAKAKVDEAEQALTKAEETYNNSIGSASTDETKLEEYYQTYIRAREKYSELSEAYSDKYAALEGSISKETESYEKKIEKQEQKMKSYSEMMEEYKSDTMEAFSEKMSDYKTDVMDTYSDMISDLREEYNEFKTEFQEKYGNQDSEDIDDKISSIESSLESDSLSVDKANNSYSQTSVSAEQKRDSAKTKAELAKEVYDNTVAQINSELESKKEDYDEIAEEYETFKMEIDSGGYVFAPCEGLISSVNVSEGDSYNANQNVAVIMDSSAAYISLSVSENDISSLSVGQECEITLSAFENKTFSGEIDTISAEPARSSGSVSYTVTVKMDNDEMVSVREGMTAEVTFLEKQVKNVLYINTQAVSYHDGSNWVKVYDSDGNTVEKAVKTGFSDGRYVEIIDGLAAGDKVAAESAVAMK